MSCGQTLTESTIVENDRVNCFADGLVAGADGITIDLKGHTIDGRTIPTGSGVVISASAPLRFRPPREARRSVGGVSLLRG